MKSFDFFLILIFFFAITPFTYIAGSSPTGWGIQWGLPYLTANIIAPLFLAIIVYAIRSNKK